MTRIATQEMIDEWESYVTGLVKYGLMPKDIKEVTINKEKITRPEEQQIALAVMKIKKGYELDPDISISTSLNQIMIVNGKLEIYAQLALALIRKFSPESRIQYLEMTNVKAELKVKRYKDQDYWNPFSFTKGEAELADLWITPEMIRAKPKLKKKPWKKYPKTMLLYSAVRLMVKFEFSDIVLLDVANAYEIEEIDYEDPKLLTQGKTEIIKPPFLPKKKETPQLEAKKEKKVVKVKKSRKKTKKKPEPVLEKKKEVIDVQPEKPKEEIKVEPKPKPKIEKKIQNNLDIDLNIGEIIDPMAPVITKKKVSTELEIDIVKKPPKKKSKFDWSILEYEDNEEKTKAFMDFIRGSDNFKSTKSLSKSSQDFPYYILNNDIITTHRDMSLDLNIFTKFYGENKASKARNETLVTLLKNTLDDLCGHLNDDKMKNVIDKRFEFHMKNLVTKLILLTKEILSKESLKLQEYRKIINQRTGWDDKRSEKYSIWIIDFMKDRGIISVEKDMVKLND
jgi:hypothetical protein